MAGLFSSFNLPSRYTRYRSDRSQYNFTATNLRFNKVKGFFKEASLRAELDFKHLDKSYFIASWPVSGIRTGIDERDLQLQEAPHFFNGKEYPEIIFKSANISKEGKKQLLITGELSIKGISRHVAFYAGIDRRKDGCDLFIDFNLDRFEYQIGESASFAIGRQIELQFDIALEPE